MRLGGFLQGGWCYQIGGVSGGVIRVRETDAQKGSGRDTGAQKGFVGDTGARKGFGGDTDARKGSDEIIYIFIHK